MEKLKAATGSVLRFKFLLALMIVSLYIFVQVWLLAGTPIDPSMRDLVMRSLGTLDAILAVIFAYFFGSSDGSTVKTAILANNNNNGNNQNGSGT